MNSQGPAWALPQHQNPKTGAHVTKHSEEKLLCLCGLGVASHTRGLSCSPPYPESPWEDRPAPSLLWCPPLQKKKLEEVASRSLQALRCQDFLPQRMGSQEIETARLVLFGV